MVGLQGEEIESDVCSAGVGGLLFGLCTTNLALWCGWMDCSGFWTFWECDAKTLCYLFCTFFEVLKENKIVVRLCCIETSLEFLRLFFLSLTMLNVSWLCNVQDLTTFYGKHNHSVLLPVKKKFKAFCHFYDKKNWENLGFFFFLGVFLIKNWLILLVSEKAFARFPIL